MEAALLTVIFLSIACLLAGVLISRLRLLAVFGGFALAFVSGTVLWSVVTYLGLGPLDAVFRGMFLRLDPPLPQVLFLLLPPLLLATITALILKRLLP